LLCDKFINIVDKTCVYTLHNRGREKTEIKKENYIIDNYINNQFK